MFKFLLWIILLILVVFFVAFNVNPKVTVHLFPGVSLTDIPLALVIIFSFLLGLLLGLLLLYPKLLKANYQLHRLEKKLKECTPKEEAGKEIEPSSSA
ncbi:MAG: lipopolysaccharide assembly protein LapA domain-containing protein [Caldimicrobium sp.]